MSVTASCHCGGCVLVLSDAPAEVTDCNCSICRRYGVLWAYYLPRDVDLAGVGPTQIYLWGPRHTAFHRCAACGCVTHWAAVDPARQRMGINAHLLPPDVLAGVQVRHLDGALSETYVD